MLKAIHLGRNIAYLCVDPLTNRLTVQDMAFGIVVTMGRDGEDYTVVAGVKGKRGYTHQWNFLSTHTSPLSR